MDADVRALRQGWKQMVQGNIGGFDQIVGVWTGYRFLASQELRKLLYVDK